MAYRLCLFTAVMSFLDFLMLPLFFFIKIIAAFKICTKYTQTIKNLNNNEEKKKKTPTNQIVYESPSNMLNRLIGSVISQKQ